MRKLKTLLETWTLISVCVEFTFCVLKALVLSFGLENVTTAQNSNRLGIFLILSCTLIQPFINWCLFIVFYHKEKKLENEAKFFPNRTSNGDAELKHLIKENFNLLSQLNCVSIICTLLTILSLVLNCYWVDFCIGLSFTMSYASISIIGFFLTSIHTIFMNHIKKNWRKYWEINRDLNP